MEEEGGGRRKRRQGTECECDVAAKKPRTPSRIEAAAADDDKEEQDVMALLTLDEETVMELSELLDSSEAPFNFKVKFIEDPYTSPVIVQSSSAYVTINGNEEMCGSSFSDSDSSVMASVYMGSFRQHGMVRMLNNVADGGGAWGSDAGEEEARGGWVEGSDYVNGIFVKSLRGCCDLFETPPPHPPPPPTQSGGDGDDEMWVNFLGEDLFGGAW
ncbi:hypothetical protein ACH5RR_006136 [Cinchona calisaya]|uniref:Uncharacterized protein n=1 Tax=Cinchona calisaya TaxID=153742 RepID=A0ABD3AN57_9GENT